MHIEVILERMMAALERMADAQEVAASSAGVPAAPAADEKPARKSRKQTEKKAPPVEEKKVEEKVEEKPEKEGATLEAVRAALTAYQKVTDAKAARALLAEAGGASALSKIDKSKYQDIVDAAQAAIDAAEA